MSKSVSLDCQYDNCGRPAELYPEICMVARGCKRGDHPPLRMFMPIGVCRVCAADVPVQNFLLPQGRQRITVAMISVGRAIPDFDNAWLEWGTIGDEQWMQARHALHGESGAKH